ncbi:MAG: helix-turn-helix domain-containing protein [Treponema sp.]|nr:helix-turn-helix domain-containing protein [Treponema sp.]
MTDLRQLLGTNMKIYRKSLGFSQEKLAEKVDTATNYIAAIEAGRRFPSISVLEKIALALKIDTPELFSMKPVQYNTVKQNLEEQVWQDIGQNLSAYISKQVSALKKT